jgi:TRAP-type mannitol/chloroaromatic compound transport system substrate-binding protein
MSERKAAGRRSFLRTLAAGGAAAGITTAATLAAPNVSRAQTVTWRFQSTWPQKDIFHEFAQDYTKRVNDMTGGRLRLTLLPAGAVVGAFQMQDAVHAGTLDGGHGVTAYWYGKNKAFSLFGTAPPFFGDANQLLGWYYYGGGEALYEELLSSLRLNVVPFLTGPMPTQPLGWFNKPIKGPEDLKNLKYRTVGLSADLFHAMGAAITILPGGDIVPALERNLLDGAEFNNPSSDRLLGFPDVAKAYMVQSYHQNVECFEIMFNRTKLKALPDEQQAILRYAAESASSDMFWKLQDRYTKDLEEMRKQGVRTYRTPRSVLDAQLKAWDKIIDDLSADPFFRKVIDSQRAWARRVGGFFLDYQSPVAPAYNHYFTKKN